MTAITVELTDDIAQRLRDEARRLGVTEAELAARHVAEAVRPAASDEDVRALTSRIITEDAELLRRLA